jgi:hypothetical protein
MELNFNTEIWITFCNAGSLHSGGLTNCKVWFSQPVYLQAKYTRDWEDEDLPFTCNVQEDVQTYGWNANPFERGERSNVSFGKVFGYTSELTIAVWQKLCEFYGDDELRHWMEIEKADETKHASNFCLNIKLGGNGI